MTKINFHSPKLIAVGLSGGVDSAVAAALLKEKGYQVIGVYLWCWDEIWGCNWQEDRARALRVASQLEIPFRTLDLRREYRKFVLNYFFTEYRRGRTPNPDIVCNQKIKFGFFLKKIQEQWGINYLATGHYAAIKKKGRFYHLYQGRDKSKDQSYFLYRLQQKQLARIIFPLAELTKKEVRLYAQQKGLSNWNQPDSQGICFIGPLKLFDFLKQYLPPQKGPVLNLQGEVIGTHQGVWFYTRGQRHGFKIHHYHGQPLYVYDKDLARNRLIVAPQEYLWSNKFFVQDLHWILEKPYQGSCLVRLRNLGPLIPGRIKPSSFNHQEYQIVLKKPAFAITPGQSAVFYQDEEVLGGGIINSFQ